MTITDNFRMILASKNILLPKYQHETFLTKVGYDNFIHTSYQQTLQITGYKTLQTTSKPCRLPSQLCRVLANLADYIPANLADYQLTLQINLQYLSKTMSPVTVLLVFSMAALITAHDDIEITEESEYYQGCVGREGM